jgi:hypothetical protein
MGGETKTNQNPKIQCCYVLKTPKINKEKCVCYIIRFRGLTWCNRVAHALMCITFVVPGERKHTNHATLPFGSQKAYCIKTWAETEGWPEVDRCRCVHASPSSHCSRPALLRVLLWPRGMAEKREQNIWMSLWCSRLVLLTWTFWSADNKWFTALIPSPRHSTEKQRMDCSNWHKAHNQLHPRPNAC